MTRAPHICVAGRFVPLKATELSHAANDAHRVTALIFGANDNPLFGRPFGGPAA